MHKVVYLQKHQHDKQGLQKKTPDCDTFRLSHWVNWIEILNGNQIQIKVTKWIQIGGKSPVADI